MKIAIAGAGISGLASAVFLARAGHYVVVFDKAPAPAPVGSGLIVQPVGQVVLQELGLLEAAQDAGASINRLWAENMTGRTVLDVRYSALGDGTHGLGIHRASLFDLLLKASHHAEVDFEFGREVLGIETTSANGMALGFANGTHSKPFEFIVDAMGIRSPLIRRQGTLIFGALWTNVPWPDAQAFHPDRLTQRYSRADTSSGVMPIGKISGGGLHAAFFWTLRQRDYDAWRKGSIEQWKDAALTFWPALEPCLGHIHDPDQFVYARYAHDTWHAPVEGRLVHIGDAWHAASPQLGQGANMALLDAHALACALEETADIDAALSLFLKMRSRHVKLYQAISWAFTPVYQSGSTLLPLLRDVFVEPVAKVPAMQRLLASLVAGELGK